MIQIKHLDGSKVLELEIPEGASVHRELMGEHYMRMQFSLGEPVYLKLGDYVDTDFGRFELTSPYSPKYNTDTDGYDYDLQLDAYYIKWKNKKCRYNPKNAASETSFHLTASVSVHLEVIIRSINAISKKDANFLYQGKEFSFVLKGFNGDVKAAKYKQYDNTDIIAALNDLATVFESEWWVEDNIIYFGRCELGEEVSFELNKNVEYMSSDVSKAEYANRIIAFGSTRNLPRDYRKDTTSEVIINGIAQKRLMLPLSECPNGYIQDTDIKSETEAIEAVVIDEDIYPRTKCKVSKVETYTSKVMDEETGEEIEYTYYRLTDGSGFNFSSDFIIEGETLHILFQSGKMNGMDFECQYNDKEKYYEVVLNENYGRPLPDVNLHPEVNDEFVLYNWDATKIGDTGLIDAAERELFDAMKDKLAKMKIDPNTHECKMNSVWYEREMASADGEYVHYTLGQKVSLKNPAYNKEPRHSRIIGFDINLDIPYDTPTYQVGEATVYSQGADLQAQIDSLTFNGVSYENGGTGGSSVFIITSTSTTQSTDINVHSAKRSDQRFLRKDANDTARGVITHEQQSVHQRGAQFGSMFVSGLAGVGGRIDKDGNAELESLVLRSFLEVPELRFNRIDVVSGELWNSIAFGTISAVTINADGKGGVAWVHLEKTERCGLHIGDICRGIFADFGDGKPKDENEDDNGFQKTYGFSTAYFTPTAIIRNEEGEFGFQYAIQAGTKVHPCAYMKFAVYGSFTDPSRRASAYFTRSYMRYLKNVQTWRIMPDDNIASQFGNLDGLTIGGMQMKGEGTFLSNIYMTGAVIQFSPEQKKELMGQDAYSVVLSDYEAVLHVSVDGFVRDINKIREVVASNGNVMAMKDGVAVNVTDLGYNAATAVQVYKGKSMMHHALIVGELAYTIVPVFYNCEGFIANGVLVVNKIVNPEENAYVDMEVNCEGFAVFTKHYAITVIKDASSPVVADLDNEMDTVVENPLTGDIIGSPLVTNAHMHYGTDEMTIVSMSANLPLPNGIACEVDGSKATISVGKDAGAASTISFRVVGKTAESETLHTREVRFIANKVKSQYQLKLVPSVAEVKVDADGKFNGSESVSVKCQVLVNDGTSSLIPDTYEALKGYRARMFYGVNVKSDVPDFANEVTDSIYADGVAVTSSDDSVTFWLYYYPNGINVASGRVRFDMETIHVLHDASDSFTQFVFKRVNADSVAAPKGGSYSSPLPDGWSDGVPAGSAKLWMSSRRFTSNGKNQDDAWSTPRPMTDTADFDVCFHDAVSGDAAPSAPPKDMHPTQTGMSGNNGWYDDGKTTSEWMAMATCSNGVWSDWSIVKIVGESPVIADIDNEMDGIGVGSDGILDVATSTSTNVCMYHGSRLMQIRSVSVSGLPSGVTASTAYPSSSDHSRCTVTFNIPPKTDFSVNNRYAITITVVATYNGVDYTRTLTYTLLGTTNGKDGEVYYLQPSTTAVKRNKDLVYSPSTVTCARYIKKGTSDAVASSEGELTMSTDGGSTWDAYKSVSNFSGISSIIYRWMLNGVEIDRETVPVVIDGVGIKNVTKFYALSTSDEKVTGTWGTELPTMTSINRYLWCYEKITYTDGSTQITDPIIIGVYGEEGRPGLQGLIVRTGEWVSGAYYRCDEGVDCGFLDVVLIKNNSAETGWDAYKCIKEHPSSSSNSPTSSSSSTYWQYMSNIGALFTSLIIAKNAKLTFAQANQLLLENNDATPKVTGGLSGGGGIQIWAGSDGINGNTPNNPKFYVTSQGEMYAKSGVFEGSIRTNFITSRDENAAEYFDKISGAANTIILPNGSGNAGREVTIYNGMFNQTRVPHSTIIKVNGGGNIMGAKIRESGYYGSVWKPSVYAQSIEFWGGIIKFIALPYTLDACLWMIMFARVEGGYLFGSYEGNSYTRDINDPMYVNGLRFAVGPAAGSDDNTIYFVT